MVPCQTRSKARELLRDCLEYGKIIPSRHFRDELANEEISFEDVWNVLRRGRVYEEPEEDLRKGEWKYRIEGAEPGGKWIVIVFCFRRIDTVVLITIFSVETRKKQR